jgi:hypothetical protein
MSYTKFAAGPALAAALVALLPSTGQARIVCDNEFQVVQGSPIATPACGDRYLARVAQGYGMRVNHVDIRNPGTKARVCEFVGNDIRLRSICSGWRNDTFGGPRIGF